MRIPNYDPAEPLSKIIARCRKHDEEYQAKALKAFSALRPTRREVAIFNSLTTPNDNRGLLRASDGLGSAPHPRSSDS